MFTNLAQTMIDPSQMQQDPQQPQMAMQQPAPMAPPTVPNNQAAYQMGPPAPAAPPAADQFLHHLGKALQDQHAQQQGQGGGGGGDNSNPYAINYNPSGMVQSVVKKFGPPPTPEPQTPDDTEGRNA